MSTRKPRKQSRGSRRTTREMMGRGTARSPDPVDTSADTAPLMESSQDGHPRWLLPALAGLVLAAIASGIAAGSSGSPREGVAVAVGVLFVGLSFGMLFRPPPLRERPGDDTAIDFGRSEPGERTPSAGPSRAERRRQARDARRR